MLAVIYHTLAFAKAPKYEVEFTSNKVANINLL